MASLDPMLHLSALRTVVQATDVMLVYLDADFVIRWVNEAYAATCRKEPGDLVGHGHFDLFPHPENEAIFTRVVETGEPVFYKDKPFTFPDQPERGTTYWDWSLIPVRGEAGTIEGLVFSLRETTPYKRNELALRESEEKYAAIFARAPFAVSLTREADGIIVDVNQAFVDLFGYAREELVGRRTSEFGFADDDTRARIKSALMRDGDVRDLEVSCCTKSGRQLTASLSLQRLGVAGSGHVLTTLYDITARKEAELATRKSEQRFRHLVEVSTSMVWVTPPTGIPVEDSSSWRQFTGRSLEQWLSSNWSDVLHPEDRDRVLEAWSAATASGSTYDVEFRMLNAAGEYRDVAARAAAVRDERGAIVEWVGMNVDITERKRAEAALRRARDEAAELALFPQANPDPVLRIGPDFKLKYANPISHLLIEDLIRNGEPAEALRDGVRRALQAGTRVRSEITSQDRTFLMSFAPRGGSVNVYAQEITTLKQAENDLRRVNQQLREADRRKDEFLALLAHELRNPLAPIRTAVHLMKLLPPGHSQSARAREIVERQVTHLARLVDDLLDVGRITSGKLSLREAPLDLCQLLDRILDDYRYLFLEKHVALERCLPPSPVVVAADPERLSQALTNLLGNALKFTAPEGHAAVTMSIEDSMAVIRVTDDGAGIDPELLPRLFQPFTQADRTLDRSGGGLGLGLSLTAGVIRLHNGEIDVHSDGPGRGTEFVVRLPLLSVADPPHVKTDEAASGRSQRVLVIEDNRDAAESLRALLEAYGHLVEVAHDGASGLAAALRCAPDIVVCDIGLPGMDGFEVARRIRQHPALSAARLFAVSGYGDRDRREQARHTGFERHFTKPVDVDELLRAFSESRALE